MRASRPTILTAIFLTVASGCGDKPREPNTENVPKASDAVVRRGPYSGTLACADCSGIRTELLLFAPQSASTPGIYHLRQTYLGTRDGDRTLTSMGRWKDQQGSASDPKANLLVLDFDKPEEQRSFVRVDANTLRLLDRSQAEIQSSVPHDLALGTPATAAATLVAGEHPSPVTLQVNQELIVQLPANRATGYTWALADSTSGVVALQSTLYVQDNKTELAVGVGGNEYLRFRAQRAGNEALQFAYRRPWEQQAAPARTASVQVTVQ